MYVSPIADTHAYCLLKNHFHLLIRTRSEKEIRATRVKAPDHHPKFRDKEQDCSWMISNAFASLFKSYAQAINKAYQRTGRLFEEPFRRILVDNDTYFTELVYYIHHNPEKHGFVRDFKEYPHSSYHSLLHTADTKLKRNDVINWFGDRSAFESYHLRNIDLENLQQFAIEFD